MPRQSNNGFMPDDAQQGVSVILLLKKKTMKRVFVGITCFVCFACGLGIGNSQAQVQKQTQTQVANCNSEQVTTKSPTMTLPRKD